MRNNIKKYRLKNLNTPIVLICFNRPAVTKKIFQQIKKQKPSKLFIIMDGPRLGNNIDLKNCKKVKKIISQIDWKCKVFRNFSNDNLGLKKRVISGLDWVFKKVDRAIILEDDCYPNDSFFFFCETMLNFYKKNKNIGIITGNNFQNKPVDDNSYYFSKYSHIWGWATWRRTWKLYNDNDQKITNFIKSSKFKKICEISDEQKYWFDMHNQIKSGVLKSWAYYFLLNMWKNNYLTVTPNLNLIKNLDINSVSSSNPSDSGLKIELTKTVLKFPLTHPKTIKVNKKADNKVFYSIYKRNIITRAIYNIKKMINIKD